MNMVTVDVEAILLALGIAADSRAHEANGLCPLHKERTGKEDSNPSWWINLETGMHICFSCGYKGNLLQLIADIQGFYIDVWGKEKAYDYKAAEDWLRTIHHANPEQLLDVLRSLPTYIVSSPKPLDMSEARLAIFDSPPSTAISSRRLTEEAVRSYSVLWDTQKKSWILPLREPHFNKLMGWQEKGTVDRYFRNRPTGLQKSKTLFGIENQQEDMVVVVESPLDCVRIASAGVPGAVAVCGSSVSEDQVKLLRYSDKIIAAFDNPSLDKAGLKAAKEMREYARKYGLNLYYFNYGESMKKDPGDMTDEEILWGIENAKSYILGESAYVQGDAQAVST
jgi:5S rRNA maturation endonuclease (ribonuclease M5)